VRGRGTQQRQPVGTSAPRRSRLARRHVYDLVVRGHSRRLSGRAAARPSAAARMARTGHPAPSQLARCRSGVSVSGDGGNPVTANAELAARARVMAARGGPGRSAYLALVVVLSTTRSLPAARRALDSDSVPGPVRAAALAALAALEQFAA